MPAASRARCRPEVAEFTAIASTPPPRYSAKSSSNRFVLAPVVSHPLRRQSTTSAISSSPICGRKKLTFILSSSEISVVAKHVACDPVYGCDLVVRKPVAPFPHIAAIGLFGELPVNGDPPVDLQRSDTRTCELHTR